jgi:hypothetical protein
MMDAKLRADLAVLRKKQGRESASRSSQDSRRREELIASIS